MKNSNIYDDLFAKIQAIFSTSYQKNVMLQKICDLLHQSIPGYDWVGFYMVDPNNKRKLILGPYAGNSTEHAKIDFGQGICGQAAESEETIIVDDVNSESNYLSCNINVRSEIVLPIFKNKEFIGEFDLDSHTPSRFGNEDKEFLLKVIELIIGVY